ncbi:hypothetical protein Rsub_12849 [Raphidocelis subcapitata]|uniref:Uncharacterized protein n=1 Tax=Raphidocelis subcapitata TaxID=307507 RepID=A0A2V0PRB8_9CHLO|nr:hypothetical protein Rsub_12849 [Raphidocelis subcapitata]|eukprot:GBG00108.1 hypothetical protein Rsub_12849 [Raphidocelis subcapitata]
MRIPFAALLLLAAAVATRGAAAQRGPGPAAAGPAASPGGGMGMAMGMGMGMGMGPGGGMMMGSGRGAMGKPEWMAVWQGLLSNHAQISRDWRPTAKGIESQTKSNDERLARLIQLHVAQMAGALDACAAQGGCQQPPLRGWDPLFVEVFRRANEIKLKVTNTTNATGDATGVAVQEEGATDAARALARAHAAVVSDFARRGHAAMMEAHEVPKA